MSYKQQSYREIDSILSNSEYFESERDRNEAERVVRELNKRIKYQYRANKTHDDSTIREL